MQNLMKIIPLLLIIGVTLTVAGQSESPIRSNSTKQPFLLLIAGKPTIALGAPVEIRVKLTNTSSHAMNGSTGNVRGFSGAYTYDIRDESGRAVEQKRIDPSHQSSGEAIILKPGESRDEITRISEVYDLWPGKYTIQLSMPVSDNPVGPVIRSNRIAVTITP
jgi:hypothetical protein